MVDKISEVDESIARMGNKFADIAKGFKANGKALKRLADIGDNVQKGLISGADRFSHSPTSLGADGKRPGFFV